MKKFLKIIKIFFISILSLFCLIILVLLFFILTGYHPRYKYYYDVQEQKIKSCKGVINNITIENDSITKKGFLYESPMILEWQKENVKAPEELSLDNISSNYFLLGYHNLKPIKKIKLNPKSSYIFKFRSYHSFSFRVWTDKNGKVYKTTHSNCKKDTLIDN